MNRNRIYTAALTVALITAAACGGSSDGDCTDSDDTSAPTASGGTVTFSLLDGDVYRVDVETGDIENISAALDAAHGSGEDGFVNISADGDWLVLDTERGHSDCSDWACLAVASADLSTLEPIISGGDVVHPAGEAAIAAGGDRVVYVGDSGPNTLDLYLLERAGGSWGGPVLLTADSPHDYNTLPAFSPAGDSILFDCGATPYGQERTGICEVSLSGDFTSLLSPASHSSGNANSSLRSPTYAPDGTIVFEADWLGEQLWRFDPASGELAVINNDHSNDNTPCVLPDGRIASLWLGRPGGAGEHELKLMEASGAHTMLLINEDIVDSVMGCGG